ncbi:hypothetical protein F5Y14DRAFT_408339 [Nemania sp. NC0429]|nr:hypothetical protein F5Y14DRAFT_408339 [Nemania sp. NC0429]
MPWYMLQGRTRARACAAVCAVNLIHRCIALHASRSPSPHLCISASLFHPASLPLGALEVLQDAIWVLPSNLSVYLSSVSPWLLLALLVWQIECCLVFFSNKCLGGLAR